MIKFIILSLLFVAQVSFASGDSGKGATADAHNFFPPKNADSSKVARPGQIELVEPAYHASITGDTTTLRWKASEGAEVYHVQVATDPNFKWLVSNVTTHQGTSFEVKGLEKGKNYWWRVAGRKLDNEPLYTKGWFAVSTFETK